MNDWLTDWLTERLTDWLTSFSLQSVRKVNAKSFPCDVMQVEHKLRNLQEKLKSNYEVFIEKADNIIISYYL